jgi:hypothetical protein
MFYAMARNLELRLQQCALLDPGAAILEAQWKFDKPLLSSALQAVAQTYPHYSRHDASHSNAILVQIERMLGRDRINHLCATDVWLLLEAAYSHDSGMIVTAKELDALWSEVDFRRYLATLKHHADRHFREAAQWLEKHPLSEGPASAVDWPLRVMRSVRLVVAEYRRRDHAAKSADIVADPSRIGLKTPRAGLIPERLFGVLARICSAHGCDLRTALELPHRESGISDDDAHPMFVACMLRLGDLLDLDNGRFCPVMLASFGALPDSSVAHLGKHASIKHLRVDTEVIEIQAECSEEDAATGAYDACTSWLDMLKSELKELQSQWTLVAPMPNFGTLPAPRQIEVKLMGLTSLGRLEVPPDRFARVLQGANIYGSRPTAIREVLQNAVDATLLRLWIEKRDAVNKVRQDEDPIPTVIQLLKDYPITVTHEQLSETDASGKQRWSLEIKDNGIGIGTKEIEYIAKVGTSRDNPRRRELKEQMPEWLLPSGIFGIGLQSLFMMTESIRIRSRSRLSGEAVELVLRGGANSQRPTIQTRLLPPDLTADFGTSILFELEVNAQPESFSFNYDEEKVTSLVHNFDPVLGKELPIEARRIEDAVANYAKTAWVPIRLGAQQLNDTHEGIWFYDRDSGTRIILKPAVDHIHGSTSARFRGVPVERCNAAVPYFFATVDVLAGTAEDVLTLDRRTFRRDARVAIEGRIQPALWRAVGNYLAQQRRSTQNVVDLSFVSLALYARGTELQASDAGEEWKSFVLSDSMTLGKLVKNDEILFELAERKDVESRTVQLSEDGRSAVLKLAEGPFANLLEHFLRRHGYHMCVQRRDSDGRASAEMRFSRSDVEPLGPEAVPHTILTGLREVAGCRRTIPCLSGFHDLALEKDLEFWSARIESALTPRLLLPFAFHDQKVRITNLHALVGYVSKNMKKALPLGELVERLIKLIQHIDQLMATNEDWNNAKEYDLDAALRELRAMNMPSSPN